MKKQFNLEAALNGEPFECEDGSQVLKWMYCEEVTDYPITCYLKLQNNDIDIFSFTRDGFYLKEITDHILNLVMSPKKVTRWFNVYDDINGFILGNREGFKTEQEAKVISKNVKEYIKTIPIEIELP